MLLKLGFKNFYSFKEGCEISFELPASCTEDFSNVLCIKGKNASGKTNVIKAIEFLHEFCTNSFSDKPDDEIAFDNFFDNSSDTHFYIEFMPFGSTELTYKYELVLNKQEVKKEVLYRKVKSYRKLVEREGNVFTKLADQFTSLSQMKLRKNASFISSEHQYDVDKSDTIKNVYSFFLRISSNVFPYGYRDDAFLKSYEQISKFYHGNESVFSFTKHLITKFDTGISDIKIFEGENIEDKSPRYFPVFLHELESGETKGLLFHDESHGTKSLYKLLVLYATTLYAGGILCMDEFDVHLHPDILPELINLFTNPEINQHGAQLIFSTHDADILDLMGQYRTYIVDKEANESFCYRLDEIPGSGIRNDRPISGLYTSGKLGGVPDL